VNTVEELTIADAGFDFFVGLVGQLLGLSKFGFRKLFAAKFCN